MNAVRQRERKMRKEYSEKVKEEIIKTVETFLKKEGCEQVTIRSVAQHLDMAIGSIYTYFPDKITIFREIYKRTCKDFLAKLKSAPQQHASAEENFIDLIILACDFRIQNSYRYREIIHHLKEEPPEELYEIRDWIRKQLSHLKLRALTTTDKISLAERSIFALIEGIAVMSSLHSQLDIAGMVRFALRALLAGWKN
jgi:AcrR family transcriptional regulator